MIQNYTELNTYKEHPYKHQLKFYKIRQFDISKSLGINEASLSRMLASISPMTENVENEIESILNGLKSKSKTKAKRITKRKKS